MTERGTADSTRQGDSDTAPKPVLGAPPMTLDEAAEWVEKLVWWRSVPSKSGQALLAYQSEVKRLRREDDASRHDIERLLSSLQSAEEEVTRLRAELSDVAELERREATAWAAAYQYAADEAAQCSAELARIRDALATVIGCCCGDGPACTRDPYTRGICCAIRRRMERAGMIEPAQRQDEPGDGA